MIYQFINSSENCEKIIKNNFHIQIKHSKKYNSQEHLLQTAVALIGHVSQVFTSSVLDLIEDKHFLDEVIEKFKFHITFIFVEDNMSEKNKQLLKELCKKHQRLKFLLFLRKMQKWN